MNGAVDLIAARALLYGGVLAAFGLPVYLAVAPASARVWLEPRRWPWRCVAAAAAVALAATAAHLALLCAEMHGVAPSHLDREMVRFVMIEMPVGCAAVIRMVALAVLLAGAGSLRGRRRIACCSGAGAVAVVSLAWNGHAMMQDGAAGWLHAVSDQIHLVAAGVWLGALVALLGLSMASGEDGRRARREAFTAFSFTGTVVVAALVLTGVVNTVMTAGLPGGGDPLSPAYLVVLGLKLLAFLGALALAAHNRFRLSPMLGGGNVGTRLRSSVTVELGLLAGIVLLVAVLGTLSPTLA